MAFNLGLPPDEAIFIGGIPRSGTSVMRAILGSHPDVAMFPRELPLWRGLATAFAERDIGRREERQRLVDALVTHPVAREAGVALDGKAILTALAGRPEITLGAVFAEAMRQYARHAVSGSGTCSRASSAGSPPTPSPRRR